jgi:hypothetical protein
MWARQPAMAGVLPRWAVWAHMGHGPAVLRNCSQRGALTLQNPSQRFCAAAQNGPGNVELMFTVRLHRPVHALTLVQPPAAAATSSGGGDAGHLHPGGVLLAACCDEEVHTIALGGAGGLLSPRSSVL